MKKIFKYTSLVAASLMAAISIEMSNSNVQAANTNQASVNQVATTSEEKFETLAYAPAPVVMQDAQMELFDANGNGTGVYVNTDTYWKVFAKKTINGQLYYRIGNQSQWVQGRDVKILNEAEEAMTGVVHVPVLAQHPTWKIGLVDSNGRHTGQYIATNTNWKVFAKKSINGKLYYRLGTQNQWIPAEYVA